MAVQNAPNEFFHIDQTKVLSRTKVRNLITTEIFMVQIMKIDVFWEKTPCGLLGL